MESRSYPCKFHICKTCRFYRSKSSFIMLNHVKQHETRSNMDTFLCGVNTPEIYECEYCEYGTDLKVNLTEHFRIVHKETEGNSDLNLKCFNCESCDCQTNSLLVLLKHLTTCKCVNYTNKVKKIHMEPVIARNGVRYFKCPHCVYKTKWEYVCVEHILDTHAAENINWFQCKYCEYKTKEIRLLKKHIRTKHIAMFKSTINIKWYGCEQCSRFKTKSKKRLENHIKWKHSSMDEVLKKYSHFVEGPYIEQFECKYCPFKAKNVQILESHINWVHVLVTEVQWRDCEHCNLQTTSTSGQKQHVTGENINWGQCSHCVYKSIYKWNFRKLVKSKYTGKYVSISQFKCNYCTFKAENFRILRRHINWMHNRRKCLQCEYCLFRTAYKNVLKNHISGRHATEDNVNWSEHNYFKTSQKCIEDIEKCTFAADTSDTIVSM